MSILIPVHCRLCSRERAVVRSLHPLDRPRSGVEAEPFAVRVPLRDHPRLECSVEAGKKPCEYTARFEEQFSSPPSRLVVRTNYPAGDESARILRRRCRHCERAGREDKRNSDQCAPHRQDGARNTSDIGCDCLRCGRGSCPIAWSRRHTVPPCEGRPSTRCASASSPLSPTPTTMSALSTFRADLQRELSPILQEADQAQEMSPERVLSLVEGLMDRLGRAEPDEPSWRSDLRRNTIDRTLEDALIKAVSLLSDRSVRELGLI